MAIGLFLLPIAGRGQTALATIGSLSPTPFVLGDTIEFFISINALSEKISGYELYLTLDADILKPVLVGGRPFTSGGYIAQAFSDNDMAGDSLHLDPDENGIPGWQLNYFQQVPVADPFTGQRPAVSGTGIAAIFKAEIVGLPPIPANQPTLELENQKIPDPRQTHYFRYHPEVPRSSEEEFANFPATYTLDIAGIAIRPVIPDTVIVPGSTLDIYLGDHYTSNVIDSAIATWAELVVTPVAMPGGETFDIIPLNGPTSRLQFVTNPGSHFQLEAIISVSGTDPGGKFFEDSQELTVIVDHWPVFDQPIPASFVFDEDTQYGAIGNGSGGLFTDQDDFGANLTILLDPDGPIHVSYDNAPDSIFFFADTNWNGSATARLTIEDALFLSIDTLLSFTVNAVNDTPSIDLSGVLLPGDTLILHHNEIDTLDLGALSDDVDDGGASLFFGANFIGPPTDTTHLLLNFVADQLYLQTTNDGFFDDIDLEITATDDSSATATDTIIVSIRSWPPEIIEPLADIILLTVPVTSDTISLSPLVTDNDTPVNLMSWSFAAFSAIDTTADALVTAIFDSIAQEVIISAAPGHAAIDLLKFTVLDDDNNIDTAFAKLAIFNSLSPVIFPFPQDTVFMGATANLLDLDDFVLDPQYTPSQLTWAVTWNSLANAVIGSDKVLTVTADNVFFGWDTLTFIVTNPENFADTSDLILRIIPEFNMAPVWSPMITYEVVNPDTTSLFKLPDVVRDDFTTDNLLIYAVVAQPSPLEIIIDLTTWDIKLFDPTVGTFPTWLYFTAEDEEGLIGTSDTVFVEVKDSWSPVWTPIPNIEMFTGDTKTDTLSKYLSDKDSPLSSITVTVSPSDTRVITTFDAATFIVTYTARKIKAETRITMTALDNQGNTKVATGKVFVRERFDPDPPEGLTTFFYHPVQKKRIEYLVVADSTTTTFNSGYLFNDRLRTLIFASQDTLASTFSWYARDKMENEGVYTLFTEVSDQVNNVKRMQVSLTVALSKSTGGVLTSPDGQLRASYPALNVPEGHLIIISEEERDTAVSGLQYLTKGQEVPVYELSTNLPDDILLTLSHEAPGSSNDYYAFYDVTDRTPRRLDTYRAGANRFEAYVPTGTVVSFAKSTVRAFDALPEVAQLWAHPNPFNATLQIRFMLRLEAMGRVTIYNLLGQQVFAIKPQIYEPGIHSVSWNGRDQAGRYVPSGIYFVRLSTAGGITQLRKVTLLK